MRKSHLIVLFIISIALISCENTLKYPEDNLREPFETISDSAAVSGYTFIESDDMPLTCNAIRGTNVLQYSDGYLFFHNNYGRDVLNFPANRTLMKYNVMTGNLTSVCPDSLCLHNTIECPFYAMFKTMYVFDGNIAYAQLYSKNDPFIDYLMEGQFMLYNLQSGKATVRNKIQTNNYSENGEILCVDNFVLYYESVYNEELDEWMDGIYKWNTENNTVELLHIENQTNNSESDYPYARVCEFLFTLDSRIYFTDGAVIFSTDSNFEDRKEHINGRFVLDVITDGKYIYYGVPVNDGSYVQSLHRVDFDGKNDIDLNIEAQKGNISITSKYIYYKKYDEISIGKNRVSGYYGDNIVLYNSEIWRSDHNGENHELVYKFEGDMKNHRILHEIYVGNYIYGLYNCWKDPNNDGVFEDGDNYFSATADEYKIMRIDVNTGDIYIIDGIR
ncbi:MAG: hypothetical protein ACOX4O_12880 [Eubacteriales bacterium]|jgi:hypothetical protein